MIGSESRKAGDAYTASSLLLLSIALKAYKNITKTDNLEKIEKIIICNVFVRDICYNPSLPLGKSEKPSKTAKNTAMEGFLYSFERGRDLTIMYQHMY
ncbi:MAG: hypothetical protein IJK24_01360 [Oscillospiraceae bacterium]|nr:hypothetical protein [Oscillospiraceae bacterium]